MNNISKNLIWMMLAGVLSISPLSIHAAKIDFQIQDYKSSVSGETVVDFVVDPLGENLNVVEGEIEIGGLASDELVVNIENGKSILPLWPTAPEYFPDKKIIRFTGGVPNGFKSEGSIFRLRLLPQKTGELNLKFLSGAVYLNDGKGTKGEFSTEPLTIKFEKDKSGQIVAVRETFGRFVYVIILLAVILIFLAARRYLFRKNV